ncbi:MAG: hypothetical protein PHZ03_02685 [Syntrophomonas sp.]|nr:hypothetical protein [Syntrophomonas sp.]
MSLLYISEYQNKMKFADEAVMNVQSGDWLYYAFGASSYSDLDIAMAQRKGELQDVKMCSASTGCFYHTGDLDSTCQQSIIYPNSLTKYLQDFETSIKPSRVEAKQVSIMGKKNRLPNIIFMAAVSPMDKDGYFGLWGNSSFDLTVLQIAHIVILEVNENICRLSGADQDCIHISQVNYVVPSSNAPLKPSDEALKRYASRNSKQKEYSRSTIVNSFLAQKTSYLNRNIKHR